MTDQMKGLLDMMLDESQRTASKQEKAVPRQAEPEPEREERAASWPTDVEQLLDLGDRELRAWLGAVAPNDLLCVIAEGSETFRARVMGQLDEDSVAWMKGNLELWDPATSALKKAGRDAVLRVARRLLAEGKISSPETAERAGRDQDDAGLDARRELAGTLVQLVEVAHTAGLEALSSVVEDAQHPMIGFGMKCLLQDRLRGRALEEALAKRMGALESAYRAELELIRQTVLALGRGDDAESFLRKLQATFR